MGNVQEKMFQEIKDKTIFNKAHQHSLEYIDTIFKRDVYPTTSAISDLSIFNEEFPVTSTNAEEVIDLLNTYGSPATVATTGGRYYGFVTGGSLPITLAAKKIVPPNYD